MTAVVALGGNALGNSLSEQMAAVKITAASVADLIEDGHKVVICHGNGPQVGMIQNAFADHKRAEPGADTMPLSVCVAMSQGYIGYDLQNALREELLDRGLSVPVDTLLTQVAVDADDPAFALPTKPIGPFMTEDEAKKLAAEKNVTVAEDAGRGWRRVIASPAPKEIIEIATVKTLLDAGQVVIAAGGGGIPVTVGEGHHLKGVSAVIDKDLAAERLAEQIGGDFLIILTAVEKAAINFGKPDEIRLSEMTASKAREYIAQGHFAKGSMLPKVEAAVLFVESAPGRRALITLLEKAKDGLAGKTGTLIVP
ncbi:MAG: carbamate kinase [Oscillospiraceae bacterium]|nr:carbamate kinase [Oscillospiraceae bacterium]